MHNGSAENGRIFLKNDGLLFSVVGKTFVNTSVSGKFIREIGDLLTEDKVILNFDISNSKKQHAITISFEPGGRTVAIIGVTDIDVNLTDTDDQNELTGFKTKGYAVKMMKTEVQIPGVLSKRVIVAKIEKIGIKSSEVNTRNKKFRKMLKFYLLENN